MSSVNITILSYKRAGRVAGYEYFPTARIVIPESQRDEYKKHYAVKRLIVIPDKNDGLCVKKRIWIMNNIERPLLMLDDDVDCLTTTQGIYDAQGRFLRTKQFIKLTPGQADNVIIRGFNLAEQWGCKFWGLNVNTDGRNYQQYKPFALTQPILGPFQAHLEHDLNYDIRTGTKQDYDFSLQMLRKYKKILRINKYAYSCKHGDNTGGSVSSRTEKIEIKYCRAIMRKWGEKVIKYRIPPRKMGDLLNGRVNIPIKGV